ncbi:hypothetical protein [Paenibacillus massiliensis]|uniref:hypothetical protein n=1 Tax=Paenibacillus massiliensis TaxID=225917 RepID=UPI00048FCD58|nr:hypothetical protein [Paenibacillus massiliensis]
MSTEIVGNLVSAFVGVLGVLIGSTLTYKLNHRSEMVLIRKKIIIEKIQETQHGLYVMARQFGKLTLGLGQIEHEKISKEEFLKISDQVQEECGTIIRAIRVNEVFLKEFISKINQLIDQTNVFHDLIYDAYTFPNSPSNRNYSHDQLSYEHIEYLINKAIETVFEIKNDLDQKIEIELQ